MWGAELACPPRPGVVGTEVSDKGVAPPPQLG